MSETKAGPMRWRLAGRVANWLPQIRGSDRLVLFARGRREISGRITGRLTNGLRFDFDDVNDRTLSALIHLQYVPPALAPVLNASLFPGACFYDVGANIGLYSLWASTIVGSAGRVVAFEPATATRARLDQFVRANPSHHIEVVPCAVGAERGEAWLQFDGRDSAQATLVAEGSSSSVQVQMVSLDDYVATGPRPTLVKIDVEGHELQVLDGGRSLWEHHRPIIVLEVIPDHLQRHTASYADILRLLDAFDYELYDLTHRGLRPSSATRPTMNVLALCPDVTSHNDARERLARATFARNQTV